MFQRLCGTSAWVMPADRSAFSRSHPCGIAGAITYTGLSGSGRFPARWLFYHDAAKAICHRAG